MNDKKAKIFGSGVSSDSKIRKPTISEEELQDEVVASAYSALCSYIDAYNNGESAATLETIKTEFKNNLGFIIYTDDLGKLAVKDINNNDILINT